MKNYLLAILCLFFIKSITAQPSDEAILIKLNHDWIASYVTHDTATMNKILSPDMQLVSPSGKIFSKPEMLKNLLPANLKYLSSNVDTVWVRIVGNVGLVNARATAIVKDAEQTSSIKTSYLDVYEKKNGIWQAVAGHVRIVN